MFREWDASASLAAGPRTRRLNIGCGLDERPGWVNADAFPRTASTTKVDVTRRWPWPDDAFDVVLMSHVLEHVPHGVDADGRDILFFVVEEAYRVLRPGGILHGKVPLAGTAMYRDSPVHYRPWTVAWLDYMDARHGDAEIHHAADLRVLRRRRNPTRFRIGHFRPRLGRGRLGWNVHLALWGPAFLLRAWAACDEFEFMLAAHKPAADDRPSSTLVAAESRVDH